MFRFNFVLVLNMFVILKVGTFVYSRNLKNLPICPSYKVEVYQPGIPSCDARGNGRQSILIQNFPHIAYFGYRRQNEQQYYWFCHGSLVNSRYILTNGDCLSRYKKYVLTKVRLGAVRMSFTDESKPSDYDVEQIIVHPLYNLTWFNNSIGLVKVSRIVVFSKNVRPICLPNSDIASSSLYQVNYAVTSNGNTDRWKLTKFEYEFVAKGECYADFKGFASLYFPDGISDEFFCIKKPSNVSADYRNSRKIGAPIYIDQQIKFISNYVQVACSHIQLGIASSAYTYDSKGSTKVATKIYHHLDWIESHIWADRDDI